MDSPSERVGTRRQSRRQLGGGRGQLVPGGHAPIGQAEPDRPGAVRTVSQHDHGFGPGQAHQPRQEIGPAGVDHQAPAGERPDEPGLLASQHEVAGQGQVGTGPDGRPVDGGDGGLVELPQLPDERLDPHPQGLTGVAGVEPGADRPTPPWTVAGPCRRRRSHRSPEMSRAADLAVAPGLPHPGDDVVAHLDGQRVLGIGPVEDQPGDVVVPHVVADHGRQCNDAALDRSAPTSTTVCASVRRPPTAVTAALLPLEEAVRRHLRAGDAVHVVTGHTRWTAAARELIRQWWGKDPGFTLVMLSLSSLGRGPVPGRPGQAGGDRLFGRRLPQLHPQPLVRRRLSQRRGRGRALVLPQLPPAAGGRRPWAAGGDHRIHPGLVDGVQRPGSPSWSQPFGGEMGLLAPYAPDVALVHAPMADREGNVAFSPPLLEGVWGALAARRGAVVTVERVIEDIRPWAHLVKIPAHRVLSVSEVPLGAHPGGLYVPHLPVEPYGEDLEFWEEVRDASRSDHFDEWIRHWILEPADQDAYRRQLGEERLVPACGAGPSRTRGATTRWPIRRTWLRRSAPGNEPRCTGRAGSPPGRWPAASTPCWPGREWPTWPPGWPCARPGPKGRRSC